MLAGMNYALFTYGTLEIPEVMQLITGKQFRTVAAVLHDHARYKLKSGSYPAAVYEAGKNIKGTVYFDIDELDIRKLDRYEDFCYQRQKVDVILASGERQQVMCYVVPVEKKDELSNVDWNKERFLEEELESFLRSLIVTK